MYPIVGMFHEGDAVSFPNLSDGLWFLSTCCAGLCGHIPYPEQVGVYS
jgi:hypothetical protein